MLKFKKKFVTNVEVKCLPIVDLISLFYNMPFGLQLHGKCYVFQFIMILQKKNGNKMPFVSVLVWLFLLLFRLIKFVMVCWCLYLVFTKINTV